MYPFCSIINNFEVDLIHILALKMLFHNVLIPMQNNVKLNVYAKNKCDLAKEYKL